MLLHRFSSVIVDNPAAVAAGKVLPSKWNDDHIVDAPANALLFADPDGSVIGSNKLRFDEAANTLFIGGDAQNAATIIAGGDDNDIVLALKPKGDGYIQLGPDTYGLAGWAGYGVRVEYVDLNPQSPYASPVYIDCYAKSGSPRGVLTAFTVGAASAQDEEALWVVAITGIGAARPLAGLTVDEVEAGWFEARLAGAGTLGKGGALVASLSSYYGTFAEGYALHVLSPYIASGGTITRGHGIKIDDQAVAGVTDPFAIKTGTGAVEFGDIVIVDGDVDSSGTLYSNSVVAPDATVGGGSVQLGFNNPAAATPYTGLLSLNAYALLDDAGAITTAAAGIYNIFAQKDVFVVDLATNVVTFSDTVVFANGIQIPNSGITQLLLPDGGQAAPGIAFTAEPGVGWYRGENSGWVFTYSPRGVDLISIGTQPSNHVRMRMDTVLGWAPGQSTSNADVGLARNAVGVVEVNNGTAGQLRDLTTRNLFASNISYAQFFTSEQSIEFFPTAAYAKARNTGFRRYLIGGGQGVLVSSDAKIAWGSTGFGAPGDVYSQLDVGLWRNSAGVIQIDNCTDRRSTLLLNTLQTSFDVAFDGVRRGQFSSYGLRISKDAMIVWASSGDNSSDSALDTGIYRNTAGVVEINNGTLGQYRDLFVRSLTIGPGLFTNGILYFNSNVMSAYYNDTNTLAFSINADPGDYGFAVRSHKIGNPESLWVSGGIAFSAIGASTQSNDLYFGRLDANTFRITQSGDTNQYRDLKLRKLIATGLPTAVTGLPTGTFWNNGGVVNVAP